VKEGVLGLIFVHLVVATADALLFLSEYFSFVTFLLLLVPLVVLYVFVVWSATA
jgi:hypothetical protein